MRSIPISAASPDATHSRVRTILVFRSAALGDFILASPALHLLKRAYPGSRVVLLTTQSSNKAIRDSVARYSPASPIPWVEFATPHLINEVVLLDGANSIAGLWALRCRLRSLRIDLGVLLLDPGAPWPGRLKKLLLLRVLLGWVPLLGWHARGSLNGDRAELKARGLLPHHVHGPTQFLAEMRPPRSYEPVDIVFDLQPSATSEKWAAHWWEQQCLDQVTVIAIAAGSIQPHKRWPAERFVELCAALLSENPNAQIVVVGTPSDAVLGATLVQTIGSRAINMAGQTSVNQLASLLRRCDLLVGNDGGSMHLGDAMGCRVVSIVPGIEYPDSIEPWNNREFAVRHAVPCAPCYSFLDCPKGHNKCMVDLPVAAVLDKCRQQLARRGAHVPSYSSSTQRNSQ